MFDAKSFPHYPNDMVGCFIVQELEKVKEKALENDLIAKLSDESHIIENMYDSPCIWRAKLKEYSNEQRLIKGELCHFCWEEKEVEVKKSCEEIMNTKCPVFDGEDCNIME